MTTNIIVDDDFTGETYDNENDNETEEDPLIPDDLNLKVNTKKIKWTHKNINHDFINDFHPELMTKNNRRNWRRLLVGALIAIVVLVLLIAAIILLTGGPDSGSSRTTTTASSITLEEWLGGWLSTKSFNGTWLSDDEILYQDELGNLMIYNVNADDSKLVLPITNPVLGSPLTFDFELSPDRNYLLVMSNHQKFFRYTYLAQYRIVNLKTMEDTLLTVGNSTSLQLATWASAGNALVYVHLNNIYYRPQAEKPKDYQITNNGVFRSVFNGIPDWVYEEEVFNSNKALWFSPSGKKMVFAYFDDTQTPIMNITYYGYPGSLSFQYTSTIPIHYPKGGTINPTVKLYYVDLEKVVETNGGIELTEIKYPPQLANSERILAAVAFPTENLVSATWMNRIQNRADFHLYDVENSVYNTAHSHQEKHGWVDQFESPHFSRTAAEFLLIQPRKQTDNDSWMHLLMVTNATTSPVVRDLTSGSFTVTKIVGWDQDNSLVYYLATVSNDPAQQHFYRLSTLEQEFKPECLSCDVKSQIDGSLCLYNDAKLSPDKSRYILTCAGPSVPDISIYNSVNATKIVTWEDNKLLATVVGEKSLPLVKRFTVPIQDGFEAQVRLLIPPGADLTGATKYPLLIFVYGGPNTYQVTEKFNIDWGTYLSTNKNIIYAAIDGRGSGLKGTRMLYSGYRNLGTVEIYDQINVSRHLQDNFPFIDKSKTGIWGWSYGGYAAGMSLAMDRDSVFKCGISVAPVTDWTLYDSIYTERFMGLPIASDNFDGYEQAQLLNKADKIKSNSYYLIHGTLDDNVHYQQSLLLAKVLEQKDILFRQQTYTDEDHGIASTRLHLYHSLENFLGDCFRS
ncbi:venom dipeptidyl peptidase 4-like isoform X2 [Microplitis mediator]|uniref:venom dipeptidyl peptidase 4-like isoform X2 n=1 Tax=Microplitis mediator TaxID=375433 RepID=UPI00255451C3|nr:venom dipeptidyl peptidase 4-like isoform X2 [Microplitis mediator]